MLEETFFILNDLHGSGKFLLFFTFILKFNTTMKPFLTLVFLFAAPICLLAQNTGVGINPTGSAPDPSAGLDVNYTNKGFLQPRLTTTQRNAIANPASGLSIYNTSTNCLEAFFPQFGWKKIACDCPAGPANLIVAPNPINAGSAATFSSALQGSTFSWSFQNGSPSTSNSSSPSCLGEARLKSTPAAWRARISRSARVVASSVESSAR